MNHAQYIDVSNKFEFFLTILTYLHINNICSGAPECSQQVPTLTEQSVNPQHVTNLMDMGFSASMARNALVISRGDVEESLNLLLSNPIKYAHNVYKYLPCNKVTNAFKPYRHVLVATFE